MKSINKELFIKNIDRMINNSSKGASGFWYDTEDCCGNPEVFSEIKQGIKNHKSVDLEHYDFQSLYYNGIPLTFKGQIERISKGYICFKRIYIEEMYWNPKCVVNKEDHVWMDEKGFEGYCIGDCFEFGAEVYKYIKKSDGKIIDFGLRNPSNIKKIYNYQLPSDEIIVNQMIDDIVCESCYLYDRCDSLNCIRNSKERRESKKSMIQILKK